MIDKTSPVLLADDDEYFRLAMVALLKGPLGFARVIEAGSLDEALEQLSIAAEPISLALFDLSMPGMDGPPTLGAVRDIYPDLLLAVVSASQSRQDVLISLETGVHGYIPKGLGPLELVRALNIIIGGDIFVPRFLADAAADRKNVQSAGPKRLMTRGPAELGDKLVIESLSSRQAEVLGFLVKGYSNKQIANELSLGEGTIKIHVAALLRNLGVANRAAAAAIGALMLRA